MKIRILQNHAGQFNLLSSKKQWAFSMAITDDEGNVIEENGVKALLKYNGNDDEVDDDENLFKDIRDDMYNSFGEVLEKCYKYGNSVMSSTDYIGQTLLFMRLYIENFEEINLNEFNRIKAETEKKMVALQRRMDDEEPLQQISEWTLDAVIGKSESARLKWIESSEKKMLDMREGSDMYNEEAKRVERYKADIARFESVKKAVEESRLKQD